MYEEKFYQPYAVQWQWGPFHTKMIFLKLQAVKELQIIKTVIKLLPSSGSDLSLDKRRVTGELQFT